MVRARSAPPPSSATHLPPPVVVQLGPTPAAPVPVASVSVYPGPTVVQRAALASLPSPASARPVATPATTLLGAPPVVARHRDTAPEQVITPVRVADALSAHADTSATPAQDVTIVSVPVTRSLRAEAVISASARPIEAVTAGPSADARATGADSPARQGGIGPVAVTIEPALRVTSVAAPQRPHAEAVSTSERTVHVRIGAIEIVSADSQSRPHQAAIAAAAAATPASAAGTSFVGFDAYTALRSYAPWTW